MLLENTSLQRKRSNKLKMNLGEDESFVFKHPYFFENFSFKFLGWKPKIQKAFEDIVEGMGGQISATSNYILTDHFYFTVTNQSNCYSINYIAHCIAAEVILDIENYKFIELERNPVQVECSCLDIRSILKAKFCHIDNFDNVKCGLCVENQMLLLDELSSENNNSSFNVPKRNKTSTSHESLDNVQIIDNNYSEVRENNQQLGAGVSRWKRKQPVSLSDFDTSSENFSDEPTWPTRKLRKSCKSSNLPLNNTSEIEVITLDSEDSFPRLHGIAAVKENLNSLHRKEWWLYLPLGIQPDLNYREKEFKEKPYPDRDYVLNEERKMIAYLVKNNLIDKFDKRSTWRNMHRDGHLKQRSIDSLKSHIRVILSRIESFGLPKDIEQKFLALKLK